MKQRTHLPEAGISGLAYARCGAFCRLFYVEILKTNRIFRQDRHVQDGMAIDQSLIFKDKILKEDIIMTFIQI